MTFIAPLFSARARARRAALRAARAARPGARVELVVSHPVPVVAAEHFVEPDLLVADSAGVSILSLDGSSTFASTPWSALPALEPELLDAATPVVRIGEDAYYGVHGSGTFAMSIAQLRRLARRVESVRPR